MLRKKVIWAWSGPKAPSIEFVKPVPKLVAEIFSGFLEEKL